MTLRACQSCYRRKIKCYFSAINSPDSYKSSDPQSPRCEPCIKRSLPCVLTLAQKRGPKPGKHVQKNQADLETRVKLLENTIQILLEIATTEKYTSGSDQYSCESDSSAEAILSINIEELYMRNVFLPNLPPNLGLNDLAQKLLRAYVSQQRHFVPMPIIHIPTLISQLSQGIAYRPLILALLAYGARYDMMNGGSVNFQENMVFAKNQIADNLMHQVEQLLIKDTLFMDEDRPAELLIAQIQALFHCCMDYVWSGRLGKNFMWASVMTRLCLQLGLDRLDSPANQISRQQQQEQVEMEEIKRRIWWGCFVSDRFSSFLGQVPLSLNNDFMVRYPNWRTPFEPEAELDVRLNPLFNPDSLPNDYISVNPASWFLHMVYLLGLVCQFANGQKCPEELKKLDAALVSFAMNLPINITPAISPIKKILNVPMIIQLLQKAAMLILHRSNLPSLSPPFIITATKVDFKVFYRSSIPEIPVPIEESFKTAFSNATEIIDMVWLFSTTNDLPIRHPAISYCVFLASLFFLEALQALSSSRHGEYWVESATEALEKGRNILESNSKVWWIAEYHYDILKACLKRLNVQ